MYHIGGVLRANGHLIDIIDPDICGHSEDNYHNLMDNIKHICGEKDAVVISSNTFTWPYIKQCIEGLRRNGYRNSIILGGIHPSRMGRYLIKTSPVDYIIKGDSEIVLPQLLRSINEKGDLRAINGIIFKERGEIIETPESINTSFNEKMPFPAYDLVPRGVYDSLTIESSRGCSGNCSFCSIINKRKWRGFVADIAIERTLLAAREMRNKINSNSIVFTDDHFFENKDRAIEILDRLYKTEISEYALLVEAKLKILRDVRIINIIKKYPRISIQVGVECGYDKGLIKIGKGILTKDIFDVAQIILENHLNTNVFFSFIIGFPWETKDEILHTIKTLISLVCNYNITVNCSWWLPLPSPEFEILKSMQPEIDESLFDTSDWMTNRELFFKIHPYITEKEYEEIDNIIKLSAEFGYDLKI